MDIVGGATIASNDLEIDAPEPNLAKETLVPRRAEGDPLEWNGGLKVQVELETNHDTDRVDSS